MCMSGAFLKLHSRIAGCFESKLRYMVMAAIVTWHNKIINIINLHTFQSILNGLGVRKQFLIAQLYFKIIKHII